MKKDKIKIIFLNLILLTVLLFALFISNMFTRIALAVFLFGYAILMYNLIKKRPILSIYHRQVKWLLLLLSALYLIVFYVMGFYFGYYVSSVKFSLWGIINYIIPITVIICASEVIRYVCISQKSRLSKFMVFVSMVLVDLLVYTNMNSVATLDGFLMVVGFSLFSSLACNMLYNYISVRYGYKPIIIYRLVTSLYVYIIPIIPNVYIFFRSFLRMIYPYIIYLILENGYSKTSFVIPYKDKRKNIISTSVVFIALTLLIMLISCNFRFGILVIGSESMTGAINKGDTVVFESYKHHNHIIDGDVIIFEDGEKRVVHRVVDSKLVNGEMRYYTKGDSNEEMDSGYVTNDKIVGVSLFKIQYIGWPTIWLRDIFYD